METDHQAAVVERMQLAFELYEVAENMMRQNLRRWHPEADEAEIEHRLNEWLRKRPGAEHGDGVGRPVEGHRIDEWFASRRS
jgi:hypothetical protein